MFQPNFYPLSQLWWKGLAVAGVLFFASAAAQAAQATSPNYDKNPLAHAFTLALPAE